MLNTHVASLPVTFSTAVVASSAPVVTAGESFLGFENDEGMPVRIGRIGEEMGMGTYGFGIGGLRGYVSSWVERIWSRLGADSEKKTQDQKEKEKQTRPFHKLVQSKNESSTSSSEDPKLREIPQYVLDYAPYCWLYSQEEYWPGLMNEHLDHTTPFLDYDPVPSDFQDVNLDNLDILNDVGNRSIFLTSNDDPESYPHWLGGEDNIPEGMAQKSSRRKGSTAPNAAHRSEAPVILIVVDKGSHVDAFWFFFYSFNLGNQVLGVRFGNHVGDWEHTMVRFRKGKPVQTYYSEHEWGAGFDWDDCEKDGDRVGVFFLFVLLF